MKTLTELGKLHGTDKAEFHGYTDIYARYFEPLRDQPINLLEIGIAGGASLRMWNDYFPCGNIYGIDHNPEFVKHNDLGLRVHCILGEVKHAEIWELLKSFNVSFDVICDDGGHFSDQITVAFAYGWPLLKSQGFYLIEDLHAVYANEEGREAHVWQFLNGLVQDMQEKGSNQCGKPTTSEIEFVHLFKSLVIIKKR